MTEMLEQARAARGGRRWVELLDHAEAAQWLVAETPDERRLLMIAARRAFDAPLLGELRDQAIRHAELQERTAVLLRWIGPDGLEAMVDGIAESEAAAPRQFLHDALAAEPDAFPLLLPTLASSRAHVVRHGAELLGRHGDARAVPHLAPLTRHESAAVRAATIRALAGLDAPVVLDLLRAALAHPAPDTRADAARTIAEHGRRPLLGALVRAFDLEREPAVRREIAAAIARLGGAESLVAVALDRRGLFRWRGREDGARRDAVEGLAAARTPETKRLLARLVRVGDAVVRDAADRALSVRRSADDER